MEGCMVFIRDLYLIEGIPFIIYGNQWRCMVKYKKTMVNGIPIIDHGGPGGCGCKGAHTYVYTATALGKSRVASPMLGSLYPPVLIL